MDHETRQIVTRKEFRPVQKTSSLHLTIENFDKIELNEKIESKRIQFLDSDNVWWILIQKTNSRYINFIKLIVSLETSDNIWKAKNCYCFTSRTVNDHHMKSGSLKITEKQSQLQFDINGDTFFNAKFLEMKFTITISQGETDSDKIPLQMFIDPTVQYKRILSSNKELLNDSKYSDFTFIVQGTPFKVHKVVLAKASCVFDKLFSTKFRETVTDECQITHIQPDIFKHLLNFIYCGELPDKLNEVSQPLYETAHYYQINELAEACISVERYHLSKDNALAVYGWAQTYSLEILKNEAWKIIQCEILEILEVRAPPSLQTLLSLIEKKDETKNVLEQYRQMLSELKTATDTLVE